MLYTPEVKTPATAQKRRKGLNSMAQVVRDLFISGPSKIPKTKHCGRQKRKNESWYCVLCNEKAVRHMMLCVMYSRFVQEECAGLRKGVRTLFVCPDCEM